MKIIEEEAKDLGKLEPGTIIKAIDDDNTVDYVFVTGPIDNGERFLLDLNDGSLFDDCIASSTKISDEFSGYKKVTVYHTMKLVPDDETKCPYCTFDEDGNAQKSIREVSEESTYLAHDNKSGRTVIALVSSTEGTALEEVIDYCPKCGRKLI